MSSSSRQDHRRRVAGCFNSTGHCLLLKRVSFSLWLLQKFALTNAAVQDRIRKFENHGGAGDNTNNPSSEGTLSTSTPRAPSRPLLAERTPTREMYVAGTEVTTSTVPEEEVDQVLQQDVEDNIATSRQKMSREARREVSRELKKSNVADEAKITALPISKRAEDQFLDQKTSSARGTAAGRGSPASASEQQTATPASSGITPGGGVSSSSATSTPASSSQQADQVDQQSRSATPAQQEQEPRAPQQGVDENHQHPESARRTSRGGRQTSREHVLKDTFSSTRTETFLSSLGQASTPI